MRLRRRGGGRVISALWTEGVITREEQGFGGAAETSNSVHTAQASIKSHSSSGAKLQHLSIML